MTLVTLDGPEAYFDRLAAFEADHWWSAALWRIAEHWLDPIAQGRKNLDALDVGCGAGLTLARLASRPEIRRVVGIEPSPEATEHARRRGRSQVVAGSALNLPFESKSFDVVTCLDVFQHLPSGGDRRASNEIARVLRPKGIAIIRSNGEGDSIKGLRRIFESASLQIVRSSHVNLIGSLLQEVRGRLRPESHRPHPSGGGLPRVKPQRWSDSSMAVIGQIEAYLVGRLGVTLPFGHSVMMLARKSGP